MHQHEFVGRGHCQDRKRATVFHHVDAVLGPVIVPHAIDAHAENSSFEDVLRCNDSRCFFHTEADFADGSSGTGRSRLVALADMRSRSSILTELGWLAYFLAIFIALVYLLVGLLVPHHFNDKIAIMLAAL